MNSPQKNSTDSLITTLKEIVNTTNKYNLSSALKTQEGLIDFIMSETDHFPHNRTISFRAKSLAYGIDCKCKECSTIIKDWGKQFCSKRCYANHKESQIHELSEEDIKDRIPNIKNLDETCINNTEVLLASPVFRSSFNKIHNLKVDDLVVLIGFDENKNNLLTAKINKVNQLLSYCIRIATYQGISETLFDQCIQVERFNKKSENIEFYTLIYGREGALAKLDIKSERVRGTNNPAYDHGGFFSPFSKRFVHGDISKETFIKAHESRVRNNTYQSKLSYWTERYGDDEGARLYYERQRTFSKDKLIEKHGIEDGTIIWEERQRKWQQTMNELPDSKKMEIKAKQGFWKYTNPETDKMRYIGGGELEKTYFYVIEYQPVKSDVSYIKIGVTNRNITARFPLVTIKEKIILHESNRYTNYHIERDVKRYIIENNMIILLESPEDKFDGWTECVEIEYKDRIMEVVHEAITRNTQEI